MSDAGACGRWSSRRLFALGWIGSVMFGGWSGDAARACAECVEVDLWMSELECSGEAVA